MTVRIASSNLSICPMYEELGFLVPGNFAGDGNRFRLRLFDNGGFLGTFSFDGPSVISFRHVLVWHLYHPLLFYPLYQIQEVVGHGRERYFLAPLGSVSILLGDSRAREAQREMDPRVSQSERAGNRPVRCRC